MIMTIKISIHQYVKPAFRAAYLDPEWLQQDCTNTQIFEHFGKDKPKKNSDIYVFNLSTINLNNDKFSKLIEFIKSLKQRNKKKFCFYLPNNETSFEILKSAISIQLQNIISCTNMFFAKREQEVKEFLKLELSRVTQLVELLD